MPLCRRSLRRKRRGEGRQGGRGGVSFFLGGEKALPKTAGDNLGRGLFFKALPRPAGDNLGGGVIINYQLNLFPMELAWEVVYAVILREILTFPSFL